MTALRTSLPKCSTRSSLGRTPGFLTTSVSEAPGSTESLLQGRSDATGWVGPGGRAWRLAGSGRATAVDEE